MVASGESAEENLLHNDLADHASALVGVAVVPVGTGGGELGGVLLAGGVQQVVAGQGISVDAGLRGESGKGGRVSTVGTEGKWVTKTR